jgi:glycosyltransferase involved in cell wall biosynthesis
MGHGGHGRSGSAGANGPRRVAPVRVALVHYWLVRMRGGEAVLAALMDLFPQADVFTNVYRSGPVRRLFDGRPPPRTTWVARMPWAGRLHPLYLPLMGPALGGLDLDDYDLVISSEAGPAKWALPAFGARHICYAHSPMRYIWDQRHAYREQAPALARPFLDLAAERLRMADVLSSYRVDDFVANSSFVAERIRRAYRRDSQVIHPPVVTHDIPPPQPPEEPYLFVGRLTPYKGVRAAVDACVALGRPLLVVGEGAEEAYVRRFARQGVRHVRRLARSELVQAMGRARALLHPGVEDFGITAVEVLAAGRPVIARAEGGVLDSVEHGVTGLLYPGKAADALGRAILQFEAWEARFRPADAVAAARAFAPEVFAAKWRALVGQEPPGRSTHAAPRAPVSLLAAAG